MTFFDQFTVAIAKADAYDPRLPEASEMGDGYVDLGGTFLLPEFKPVLLVVCAAIVLAFVILAASLLLTKREPDDWPLARFELTPRGRKPPVLR